jgi:hypothetical protein
MRGMDRFYCTQVFFTPLKTPAAMNSLSEGGP